MAKKHSCNKYDLMIDDYIDGLLSDDERKKLEAHLSECEECRKSLRFSLALREMVHRSAEDTPEDLHLRIMESVKEKQKRSPRKKLIRLGALSAACALICLSCVAVFATLPGNRKSGDSMDPGNDPVTENYSFSCDDIETSIDGILDPTEKSTEEAEVKEEVNASTPEGPSTDPAADASVGDNATQAPKTDAEALPEGNDPGLTYDIAGEVTDAVPDTIPELIATETDSTNANIQGDDINSITNSVNDSAPEASSSDRPGGDEITLALLIVSGLLAVASFIAFLISLSSVRSNTSNKK